MNTLPPAPVSTTPPDRRGAFRLLFFALLAIGAGNTMIANAVLPPLARQLELPDWTVGAMFSLSALLWSITSPMWGSVSTRIGRRPVVAVGLAAYAVSMSLFGVFAWLALEGVLQGWLAIFLALLSARAIFGLMSSGTNPSAQAYVADRTGPNERTEEIAALTSGFSFGSAAGPAVAAALVAWFGLISPFIVSALSAAIISFLVYTRLPETRPPKSRAGQVRPRFTAWRSKEISPFLFYAVCLSLATGILLQTFPFALMDKLDVAGAEASQFIAVATTVGAMATIFGQLVIIPRLKPTNRELMVWGALSFVVGALLVPWSDALAPLVLAQLGIGLGSGMARAGYSSGASLAATPSQQGSVAGLVVSANGMGFIISPLLGPFLYEHASRQAPFIIAAVVMLAMAVFAFRQISARNYCIPSDEGEEPVD